MLKLVVSSGCGGIQLYFCVVLFQNAVVQMLVYHQGSLFVRVPPVFRTGSRFASNTLFFNE